MKKYAISQDDMKLLEQQLIIPSAITDILTYNLKIEEEMQYGLHMALSEIDPDSAILAIGLGLRDLAEKALEHFPIAAALHYEANSIISDYAPTWLRYKKGSPMPSSLYKQLLQNIPEDLEALADLADALTADMEDMKAGDAYHDDIILANILSIQARAHIEIASFVLEELEYDDHISQTDQETSTPTDISQKNGNNIILFPVNRQ